MIESSASRRLSKPRLTVAALILSGLLTVGFVVWRTAKSITDWVATQPDQQLPFHQIELVPEPDPWLRGGKAKILEEVQNKANYPEKLPLLSLNLKDLERAFRRCPWVKDVVRIDCRYGRLLVHLVYRKPVAIVVPDDKTQLAIVIDGDAVPLPWLDVASTSTKYHYQVSGFPSTLIEIKGVDRSVTPQGGIAWKVRSEGDAPDVRDPFVLRAAKLAEFLQRKSSTPNLNRNMPHFVWIVLPGEPSGPYFLLDSEQNWVSWGKGPGDEKAGEWTSEDRWRMLLDYLEKHGPIDAKHPNYLRFSRDGVELVRGKR